MRVYDDKSSCIAQNDKYIIIEEVDENQEITFKASYIITGDLVCSEKVIALFDLVVFGNVDVEELDVKGRFICLGDCRVSSQVIVQNDIWADDIVADTVISHNHIFVQSMDVNTLSCDGNVMVGKTFSIEDVAEIGDALLCGETAFGAGRLVANTVMTVEPLDLDDGIDAIEDPNEYKANKNNKNVQVDYVGIGLSKYEDGNNYEEYISFLIETIPNEEEKLKFNNWLSTLYKVENLAKDGFDNCCDTMILIRLLEVAASKYFEEWDAIQAWSNELQKHFEKILEAPVKQIQTEECTSLSRGDVVRHSKFGKGTVKSIKAENGNEYAEVVFVSGASLVIKKFLLPDSLKFFVRLIEIENEAVDIKVDCTVTDYCEWLNAQMIVEQAKGHISNELRSALFERLMSYVGLKAKFMNDRFKEKGWN